MIRIGRVVSRDLDTPEHPDQSPHSVVMDRGALSRTHTKLTIEKRFNAGLLDEARATVVRLRALTPEVMVNHLSPSAIRSIVSSISQARGWRWARRQDRRSHFPIAE